MATKKKELLEQEAPVSETIALEDSPVPSEDTTAPDATPVDGEDLNALLAAMDQPDSAPPSDDTTSDLPEPVGVFKMTWSPASRSMMASS